MNLRKAILLGISVVLIAALVACSSNSTSTPQKTVTIAVTSGSGQSQTVGAAFAASLVATVTTNGTPTSGVTVTFTAPSSGASGTFAAGTATETDTTNSSGVATSSTFTANAKAGAYNVSASATGATSPVNFNMTNTSGPAANLAATSGASQNVTVGAGAAAMVAQVTDNGGNPVQGVSVTFTAPGSGASGAFTSTGNNVEQDTTDVNGNATASDFVANSTAGGPYNVVASANGLTSVNFALTNTLPVGPITAGNYVYSVTGTDSGASGSGGSQYFVAGVFTVDASGNITGGEQDFSDYNYFVSAEAITGGTIAVNPADSNLLVTINTGDTNIGPGATTAGSGSGTLVFSVAMASSTRGLMSEYDTWASGTGELNAQTSTSDPCPNAATTACGLSFQISGLDGSVNAFPVGIGGVLAIDSLDGISGTGSIADMNDGGTTSSALTFTASTLTPPDSRGFVTFTLNSSTFGSPGGIILDGYIVDANHIRVVENWYADIFSGTTGGTALLQTGAGGFSTASVSGTSVVISTAGADVNGVFQLAGMLTFNSGGTMGGNISYNDITVQSPQGGTAVTVGTYTVDSTGRVTVTGLTGATFNNTAFQLYLTGDGHATVLSMDSGDEVSGLGWTQASSLGVTSLSGTYALSLDQFSSGTEFDGDGQIDANAAGLTLSGFTDVNGSLLGNGLVPSESINASYSGTPTSPIISVSGNGGSLLTLYLIDGTQGTVIENDSGQLTLGYATSQ